MKEETKTEKKKAKSTIINGPDYDYDVDIQSCSSMDCTGLIPSLPQSKAEVEHYNELYRFMPGHVDDSRENAP